MPSLLRIGCEVSSISSKTARVLDAPPGKKRKVRERVYGLIVSSLPNGKWKVQWAAGGVEDVSRRILKLEGPPTPETMKMVQVFNSTSGGGSEELLGPGPGVSSSRREENESIINPSQVTAIVPYIPPPLPLLETTTNVSIPNEEPAQVSIHTGDISEEEVNLGASEDDNVSVGSGIVYDDEVVAELLSDRFGKRRQEVEQEKQQLVGTTINVKEQSWKIIEDMENIPQPFDEFEELGLRSNTVELDTLPRRMRSRAEVLAGKRASPRITPKGTKLRDEGKSINHFFMTLFPVNWKQSLKRLNTFIEKTYPNTRQQEAKGKRTKCVSEHEYWVFIGLLLLCAVQKTGGAERLFRNKQTEGIIEKVDGNKYMTYKRFKFIKQLFMKQFELDITDNEKEMNKWWRVGYLTHGFNENRRRTVASSRVKILDEAMSAYRPQTRKTGNLPNISFVLRKPEPLGTELKTVASKGMNGPMVYAEVQEGKEGMKHKSYFLPYGTTTACVLRLVEGTRDNGQQPDPELRNLFLGDSWFASLKTAVAVFEEMDSEFVGPIKNGHKHFPRNYLETTMKDWPPGTHLVLETTVRGNKYYAIGYKYNVRKVLCFISTGGAGHTKPGKPYEAKWLDENGHMASRMIPRPDVLSHYFEHSNQIDKHNHARQSQLAIEKNLVTECGYFRLFCTYLGITVTDAWKLYRHALLDTNENKDISILSFANILTKSLLQNTFRRHSFENSQPRTLPLLQDAGPRKEIFPAEEVTVKPQDATFFSSLGSSLSNAKIDIGGGRYVTALYEPPHKLAMFIKTKEKTIAGIGSYSDIRTKRRKCTICRRNTAWQCSVCSKWFCEGFRQDRECFNLHVNTFMLKERTSYWESTRDGKNDGVV